jgi:hypothetical protein
VSSTQSILFLLIYQLSGALSLLHNVTDSLRDRPNYSSPYAPPNTSVTVTPYIIIYSYAPSILWIAYGVAIGLTILSVVFGLALVSVNGGSYTTKFSTILRLAHGSQLSAPVRPVDTDGKDPTPGYVENIVVSFPRRTITHSETKRHEGQDTVYGAGHSYPLRDINTSMDRGISVR